MADETTLHGDRRRANSFGDAAELYDRIRPQYPVELIDMLIEDGPKSVLDVGCGTGIVSRLFMARGCAVLGLEPDPRMAAVARANGCEVEAGTIEEWDPHGRHFDLLTAGQAWHWVDPDKGAQKAATVLRAGGRIGLFWNQAQPQASVRPVLQDAYVRHAPDLRRRSVLMGQRDGSFYQSMADALERTGKFDDVAIRMFAHEVVYSSEEWVELAGTHSDHHTLPQDQLAGLLDDIRRGIDSAGGQVPVHYEVTCITAIARGVMR